MRASRPNRTAVFTSCLAVLAFCHTSSVHADALFGGIFAVNGAFSSLEDPSAKGAALYFKDHPDVGASMLTPDIAADGADIGEKLTALISDNPTISAGFGLTYSDGALAAGQAAATLGRVFLTSGATSPKLPQEVPGYLYLACFGDNVQAAAAAEFAVDRLGARSATVFYDESHTYTRLHHGYFQESFEAQGGKIMSVTGFDGPSNFAAALEDFTEGDVIFLATNAASQSAAAVAVLREKGITQPILGGDGYDADRPWADGDFGLVYFTTHAFYGPGAELSAEAKDFTESYVETYGEAPTAFAGLAYDAAGLLADARKRAGSDAPDAVRIALSDTTNYPGVTGTISYPDNSQIPEKSVTVLEIKDGVRAYVTSFVPSHIPAP